MSRGRFFAISLLPLLASLLAAPAAMAQFDIFQMNPTLAPQPAPAAPQKKAAPATGPAKPAAKPAAAAAAKQTTPIPKPKPTALSKPEPNKVDAKKVDTKPDKTLAKKSGNNAEPAKYAIADYNKVWDVTGRTTRADIVARFGEPQRTGDSARKPFYYFNDALTFFFTSGDTVGTMIVGNSFEPLPPNAIPPDVKDKAFIGRKRDDVLKMFGPATTVSSENYRYMPASGPYKVEFQCYDFKGHVCGQMLVQF